MTQPFCSGMSDIIVHFTRWWQGNHLRLNVNSMSKKSSHQSHASLKFYIDLHLLLKLYQTTLCPSYSNLPPASITGFLLLIGPNLHTFPTWLLTPRSHSKKVNTSIATLSSTACHTPTQSSPYFTALLGADTIEHRGAMLAIGKSLIPTAICHVCCVMSDEQCCGNKCLFGHHKA